MAFISAIACALAKCCSTDELILLSAALSQLGDTLDTILTKRELNENKSKDCNKEKDDSVNC